MAAIDLKKATSDTALILYAELGPAEIRTAQRLVKAGQLARIVPGMVSSSQPQDWPALIARERLRVLAALFAGTVLGYRSAFNGGLPEDGILHLIGGYRRNVTLPGLTVMLWKGQPPALGDTPMLGRNLFYPSLPRLLLENLTPSRGPKPKTVGRDAVEQRLLSICDARGEDALSALREQARSLAQPLALADEFKLLDDLVGSILGTRASKLATPAGLARTAPVPYDANRLALFEQLAAQLRSTPLPQPAAVALSARSRSHFAFLESYFSNFIEGTEFDVQEARSFVLEGKPVDQRPKDSHDILGVFRQALDPGWANQTLASGDAVLTQLRARHADQMRERPEVGPGEFKVLANRAGNTEFVDPRLVRGTLIEGSKLLTSVPAGTARALLALFLVSEVHPFIDGNGRLARLVMNAELSVLGICRIIVPTLFREEYLDCLRLLTRDGQAAPLLAAMQKIHQWTAAFDYEDLDLVIARMARCNAFERSLVQFKLLTPPSAAAPATGA
ncbi:Fic family protein [Rhodoferax sp.]|uniref:Fic family protein n=1 Tax=Rhodoferax sp. TaxID=50421 RepID=UPI0008C17EBB|nr:Fic family protein [Rhodoferax sp.]MDO8319990.1 Fic family protein [Rhodoferax sp.]MDP2678465.1 Fic family protein [Rhodoferax sp.]OGB54875.1 MAG: cell filamentation protein Fic [Burkholderiales bacterium RIFOXYD12_FULL_59_19]OGB82735.1 MAG: cell filamentation protein Fic [Burkholderiales bacterium RIFOXYC12_FULL_60_6]